MANVLYGRCEANKPITILHGDITMVFTPAQFWPTYWLAINRADFSNKLKSQLRIRLKRNEAGKILRQFGQVTDSQTSYFTDDQYKLVLFDRIKVAKIKVYYINNNYMRSVLLSDSYLSVNCRSAFSLVQYDKPGVKPQRDKLALELSQILMYRRADKIRMDDIYWSRWWITRKFIVAGSVITVFAESLAALFKLAVTIVVGAVTALNAIISTFGKLVRGDLPAVQRDLQKLIGGVVHSLQTMKASISKGYDIATTIWGDEHSRKLLFAFMKEYVDGTSVVDSATFKISLTIDVLLIIGTLGAGAVVVGARLAHRVGQFTVRALQFIVDLYRALKLSKLRRIIDSPPPAKRLAKPKAKSVGSAGNGDKSNTSGKSKTQNTKQTGSGKFTSSADESYDAIRRSTTDVDSIAKNTGIKPENIQKVKDHIFYKEHLLDRYVDYGVPAQKKRFDSDKGMADAWKRLEDGTFTDKLQNIESSKKDSIFCILFLITINK